LLYLSESSGLSVSPVGRDLCVLYNSTPIKD